MKQLLPIMIITITIIIILIIIIVTIIKVFYSILSSNLLLNLSITSIYLWPRLSIENSSYWMFNSNVSPTQTATSNINQTESSCWQITFAWG